MDSGAYKTKRATPWAGSGAGPAVSAPEDGPPSDVRNWVARNGHADGQGIWHRLRGGRSNRCWRVAGPAGDVVVKLYREVLAEPARNPMFGNDPRAETSMLRALARSGLAPELLAAGRCDAGSCIVYRHVEGRPGGATLSESAAALRRVHEMTPAAGLRSAPDGSAQIHAQGLGILARCADRGGVERLMDLAPKGEVRPKGEACLLHGDPVPANMIAAAKGVVLIDWQYPGRGDPCEDLAIHLSPAMRHAYASARLSSEEEEDFLAAYGRKEVTDRYRALAPWYHWRMAAYCLWRTGQGGTDDAPAMSAELEALALCGE